MSKPIYMETNKENESAIYLTKLKRIIDSSKKAYRSIQGIEDLPAWIQDKITISEHNMDAICEYIDSGLSEEDLNDAYDILEKHGKKHGIHEAPESENMMSEGEYQGRKVELGKVMQGDVKKFKVYVKNPEGKVVKVNFGQKGMKIKKNNPERRKSFRARHNCDDPGPRHKPRYWACKSW